MGLDVCLAKNQSHEQKNSGRRKHIYPYSTRYKTEKFRAVSRKIIVPMFTYERWELTNLQLFPPFIQILYCITTLTLLSPILMIATLPDCRLVLILA